MGFISFFFFFYLRQMSLSDFMTKRPVHLRGREGLTICGFGRINKYIYTSIYTRVPLDNSLWTCPNPRKSPFPLFSQLETSIRRTLSRFICSANNLIPGYSDSMQSTQMGGWGGGENFTTDP